jgi:hypothetical protein
MVEGAAHGINVILQNYPVREADDGSRQRLEFFPDFNVFLVDGIWEAISEYNHFIADACRLTVEFSPRIRDCPFPVFFKIRVADRKSERQFRAEMPDAIIDAFRRSAIQR